MCQHFNIYIYIYIIICTHIHTCIFLRFQFIDDSLHSLKKSPFFLKTSYFMNK